MASSTDPASWSSYRDAARSSAGAGLGFVLDGDGVVCLDLDHCVDDEGTVAGWARNVLDAVDGTWVEVSASGDGLHVWGYGELPHGRRITVEKYVSDLEVKLVAHLELEAMPTGRCRLLTQSLLLLLLLLLLWPLLRLRLRLQWHWWLRLLSLWPVLLVSQLSQFLLSYPLHLLPQALLPLLLSFLVPLLLLLLCRFRPRWKLILHERPRDART